MSDTPQTILDSVLNVVISVAALVALARFILWYMEKVVNRTISRNEHLEDRVDRLEERVRGEMDGHDDCRRELNEHKIESAGRIAVLESQVANLVEQLNRPYRSTDEQGETDV